MSEEKTGTEEIKKDTKDLVEHVTDFLETYYQNSLILAFLCLLVISFSGFGLAWWLGDLINSRAGGFFIVAGIYLLIVVILIAMGKKVIFPFLRNLITRKIYE